MSTDTVHDGNNTGSNTAHDPDGHDDGHAEHPSDAQYVKIAIILAILTALEVATYFFEDAFNWGPILVIMMFVKGIIVAGYFMHLKFDNRILTRVFVAGFVLACIVYAIALTVFRFWDNSGMREDYGVNARPVPYVLEDVDEGEDGEAAGEDEEHGGEEDHSEEE